MVGKLLGNARKGKVLAIRNGRKGKVVGKRKAMNKNGKENIKVNTGLMFSKKVAG